MSTPSHVLTRIAELEQQLGRGATYGTKEREHILAGTVPEWLYRARLLLDGADKEWAEKLINGLTRARDQLWPKVRFSEHELTPPPAVKATGEH